MASQVIWENTIFLSWLMWWWLTPRALRRSVWEVPILTAIWLKRLPTICLTNVWSGITNMTIWMTAAIFLCCIFRRKNLSRETPTTGTAALWRCEIPFPRVSDKFVTLRLTGALSLMMKTPMPRNASAAVSRRKCYLSWQAWRLIP